MDLPDKFHMAGLSHGGYQTMLYASTHPEKIHSIFLMAPVGTEAFDPETYTP